MNWSRIDRSLSELYALTPLQIDQLTLAEIACLCSKAEDASPTGTSMSQREIDAEIKRLRNLTPRERIDEARRTRC